MGFWSKVFILLLGILTVLYVKTSFFDGPKVEKKLVKEEQVVIPETSVEPQKEVKKDEEKKIEKSYVTVYFVGVDNNSNGVFKKVKREIPEGSSKLTFALKQLIKGPSLAEKKLGVYSEVPKTTKLLGVVESDKKIIIDVSSDIQNGGGADSLYSRMKQLIKTALINSPNKPIYLYIDGKQAEVLGGEGIMISQPLNENSLDD